MSRSTQEFEVELNFDQDVDRIEEAGPRVISDFGWITYFGGIKVTMYAKGEKMVIPELLIDGKPFERGGLKMGHSEGNRNNAIMHVIRLEGLAFTDDKPFTAVRLFTTQPNIPIDADKLGGYPVISLDEKQKAAQAEGKTVWLSDWSNLQFPALKQLPPAMRQRFINRERLPFRADNWNTGTKPREDTTGKVDKDGNPKKYYDHYWYNIHIFGSDGDMLSARLATKAGNGAVVGAVDYSNYPAAWKSAPDKVAPFVKEQFLKGVNKTQVVTNNGLAGPSIGGGTVDVDALLTSILKGQVPDPMLDAWLKG